MTDRLDQTVTRLISNIPAACKVLTDHGYISLAGQLGRDAANLAHWQERAEIVFCPQEEQPCPSE